MQPLIPALLAPHPPAAASVPSSGLIAQWEADQLVLSDGDAVASWPDLSSSARTLTQTTDLYKPTFRTNQWGTKPAVFFDGGAAFPDVLQFTPVALTAFSVFSVLMPDFASVGAYSLALLNWSLGSGDLSGFALPGDGAGFGVPHLTCRNSAGTETQNKKMSGVAWSTLTKHLATWTYDGTTVAGRSDGVARTIVAGDSSYGNPGPYIGYIYQHFKGYLAALIVYNRVLSGAEITQVESYLNGKYPTF